MNKIPSGWDYNHSSWPQRIPIVVLAIVGFLVASYLALELPDGNYSGTGGIDAAADWPMG